MSVTLNGTTTLTFERVTKMLLEMGARPELLGYDYLREAVVSVVEKPERMRSITKGLYKDTAEKYRTTPSKVERAMRHSIEVMWSNRHKHPLFRRVFLTANEHKPTNGHFIATFADYVRVFEHGKR